MRYQKMTIYVNSWEGGSRWIQKWIQQTPLDVPVCAYREKWGLRCADRWVKPRRGKVYPLRQAMRSLVGNLGWCNFSEVGYLTGV